MSKSVGIRGSVAFGGDCGCSGGGRSALALGLLGACGDGLLYESAVDMTGVAVSTVGAVGQRWADLGLLDGFTAIELLVLKSSAKIRLRIDPTRPALVADDPIPSGGVVTGSATFTVTDEQGNSYAAAVTFDAGTNTPALVLAAINAAFGAASAPQPPGQSIATLDVDDVLTVTSPGLGPDASVQLAAGAPAGLGLGTAAVEVDGTSFDQHDTEGLVVMQFPRAPYAPTKIQISGVASVDFVIAGRTSA